MSFRKARLEWPPRSGRTPRFPEVDRAAFFRADEAARRFARRQSELVNRLLENLLGD